MNRWVLLGSGIALAVLAAVGGYWVLHASPVDTGHDPTPGKHSLPGLDYAAGEGGSFFPGSSSKVRVHAWLSTKTKLPVVFIKLMIAKGWHVNANPPSLGFLIPTVVRIKVAGHVAAFSVENYPRGQPSSVRLDHTDIRVYSNGTMLQARLPPKTLKLARTAGALAVIVQLQACSNRGICLPPADVRSIVPVPSLRHTAPSNPT